VSTGVDMNARRAYDMSSRAAAAADTRRRILAATLELAMEKLMVEITLDDVGRRADVHVKTVLRHFGSRDGLMAAMTEYARHEVGEERRSPPGDVAGAVRVTVDHYELRGRAVLRALAQEQFDDTLREPMAAGRRTHRETLAAAFAPQLETRPEGTLDLLVVALDVFTWRLLRLDRGLDRETTEARMRALVEAVLG
jgi:AcrR family transcriptional regulator